MMYRDYRFIVGAGGAVTISFCEKGVFFFSTFFSRIGKMDLGKSLEIIFKHFDTFSLVICGGR